jgi:AcrR family transcriptional regulator
MLTLSRCDGELRAMAKATRPKRRGSYHHGDLRRALVEASIALVEEEGVDALTLRSVARRLGVSHAAPQHHFATKAELVVAVAEQGFETLAESLARAAAKDGAAVDRLKAAGVAYVRFAAKHPAQFRLMFGPHVARAELPGAQAAYRVLCDACAAVAAGRGAERETATISVAAWSLVHGLATLWLDGPLRGQIGEGAKLAAVADAVTDLVARAVAR